MKTLSNTEAEKNTLLIKKGAYHHLLKVTSAKKLISENTASIENFFYFMEKLCSVLEVFNVLYL